MSAPWADDVQTIRDRFEEAWKKETPPRIEDYLKTCESSQRQVLLIELMRIDLEQRLLAGEQIDVKNFYSERFPEIFLDRDVVVSLLSHGSERLQRYEPCNVLKDDANRLFEDNPGSLVILPTLDENSKGERPMETTPHLPEPAGFTPKGNLGCYELINELGRGAMGVVYLAHDNQLKRRVAIKMVLCGTHSSESMRNRFRSEAEAIARLQHPHVVQVYSWGQQDSLPYLVMEYIQGDRLDRKIAGQPQPPSDAAHLVMLLARAVHSAHRVGIIHRDLKPANILLAPPSTEPALNTVYGFPKVTDFGLARLSGDSPAQTATQELLGTPSYMPPEQAEGKAKDLGPSADIYSLGTILYELLTGRPPFVGVTIFDILEQVKNQEPLPFNRLRIHVSKDLETICLKCLQKDPQKRYASAEELADDLQRFLEGRPIVARPISTLDSIWRWCHRPERVREAGIFTVTAGIIFIFWTLTGMALLPFGGIPQARPWEAFYCFLTVLCLVFFPMILVGMQVIAHKAVALWAGLGASLFGLTFTLGMALQSFFPFSFDFGGVYASFQTRTTVFCLLSFLVLILVLMYAVALLAYYSNRERLGGSTIKGAIPPQ